MRGMLVLAPAHVGHLAMLRTLIREAAAESSFDRGSAADAPAAVEFFARLKRALVSGYFVEEDPRTGPVGVACRRRATARSCLRRCRNTMRRRSRLRPARVRTIP